MPRIDHVAVETDDPDGGQLEAITYKRRDYPRRHTG